MSHKFYLTSESVSVKFVLFKIKIFFLLFIFYFISYNYFTIPIIMIYCYIAGWNSCFIRCTNSFIGDWWYSAIMSCSNLQHVTQGTGTSIFFQLWFYFIIFQLIKCQLQVDKFFFYFLLVLLAYYLEVTRLSNLYLNWHENEV